MNVYIAFIIILVVFIFIYEGVPAFQTRVHQYMRRCKRRIKHLRYFIDDDDYDVVRKFQYPPETMKEYIERGRMHKNNEGGIHGAEDEGKDESKERQQREWEAVCERAHKRKQQGWGCVYWDGPDEHDPYKFYWQDGFLTRRQYPLARSDAA